MMKGLLVKDFRLLKVQKNFFLLIIAVAIGMALFTNDVAPMLGFLAFVLSIFTLSTISYDEFDNGNAFLFSLPVSRKDYAIEKYCLGLILEGGALVLATLLSLIFSKIWDTTSGAEIGMSALILIPLLFVLQGIMIPFQLKFGGEKGRIALLITLGLLALAGIGVEKLARMVGIDVWAILDSLSMMSLGMMVGIATVIAAIFLGVSLKISISIMDKKEF
ncbi:MAG: ABC-2 transporter permease [Blautia sp.]|jgi:ABC-2 type transport system permease protein